MLLSACILDSYQHTISSHPLNLANNTVQPAYTSSSLGRDARLTVNGESHLVGVLEDQHRPAQPIFLLAIVGRLPSSTFRRLRVLPVR